MKTGKSFKVFGFRGSLVGDGIMSLVLLNWVRKRFPDCYTYWQIARQHAHAAPLYFNHPLIDQIVISDCDEGMGPRDREIAAQCDLVFDVMPQHPLQHDWPNHRDIYAETFAMGALPLGIPLSEYESMTEEEKRPRLTKWFKVIKEPPKTIAIWPCAGYGVENKRNPSKEWYDVLISQLIEAGYRINQYGHPRDFAIKGVQDMRQIGFFDQVKQTVGCDMVISTDSGSGLIF